MNEIVYLFKSSSWLFGSIDQAQIERIRKKKENMKNKMEEEESEEDDIELQEEINRAKDAEKLNENAFKSKLIFEKKNIKKEYFGLISKYIIDFSRVFFLIDKGFDVFYLKYCDNEITTENNLIFALKP